MRSLARRELALVGLGGLLGGGSNSCIMCVINSVVVSDRSQVHALCSTTCHRPSAQLAKQFETKKNVRNGSPQQQTTTA